MCRKRRCRDLQVAGVPAAVVADVAGLLELPGAKEAFQVRDGENCRVHGYTGLTSGFLHWLLEFTGCMDRGVVSAAQQPLHNQRNPHNSCPHNPRQPCSRVWYMLQAEVTRTGSGHTVSVWELKLVFRLDADWVQVTKDIVAAGLKKMPQTKGLKPESAPGAAGVWAFARPVLC